MNRTTAKNLEKNKTFDRSVERASALAALKTEQVGAEKFVDRMNSLLANEFSIFTKTLKYHWNVTGPRFHSMHEFLDEQYNDLLGIIDDVAERIREVDGTPIGTLQEMSSFSVISEHPGRNPETTEMIEELVKGHEMISTQIRDMLGNFDSTWNDPGSEDFLTGLLKKHEQMAWMLKSHVRQ